MDTSQLLTKRKQFVKSVDGLTNNTSSKDKPKEIIRTAFVSGSHVKKFYEKTVGKDALETTQLQETQTKISRPNIQAKKQKRKHYSKNVFNINSLMKAVEAGTIKDVEVLLEENIEAINCQDQFGWTPIMSACCEGNLPMVQQLLKWSPNLSLRDKRGQTCRDLASVRGHQSIVNILDQYKESLNRPSEYRHQSDSIAIDPKPSEFYCDVCKQNVINTSYKKHLASTIHNFNSSSKRKMPTMYGIPESNKGYQILVKSGWNKEDGLGPSGEGHKFPPKTILKQDRTGLGAVKYKARVTHKLEDVRREAKQKIRFKRNLRHEKIKGQRLERNLRQMLS